MIVGCYYYLWYEAGWGTKHWGGGTAEAIRVKPKLGWYDSGDPAVIAKHIEWMKQAGMDFVILSWWWDRGGGTPDPVTDTNCKKFRDALPDDLKFCVLVEGIEQSGMTEEIADYVNDNFVDHPLYLDFKDKPLVLLYSPGVPGVFTDERFTIRWLTDNMNVDNEWYYWRPTPGRAGARDDYVFPDGNIGTIAEQTSPCPGFNDWGKVRIGALPFGHFQKRTTIGYEEFWRAIMGFGVQVATVVSFNEWHEESCIEPCAPGERGGWGEEYIRLTRFYSGKLRGE